MVIIFRAWQSANCYLAAIGEIVFSDFFGSLAGVQLQLNINTFSEEAWINGYFLRVTLVRQQLLLQRQPVTLHKHPERALVKHGVKSFKITSLCINERYDQNRWNSLNQQCKPHQLLTSTSNTQLQCPACASRIGLIGRYCQRTVVPEAESEVVLMAAGFAIW